VVLEQWCQPGASPLNIPIVTGLVRIEPCDANESKKSAYNELMRLLVEVLSKLRPIKELALCGTWEGKKASLPWNQVDKKIICGAVWPD
jgi:hypothetical protein